MKRRSLPAWGAIGLVAAALSGPASAQSEGATGIGTGMQSLAERPTLLGGPDSPQAWLQAHGVNLGLSWTQYGQALVSPSSGNNDWLWDGKLYAKAGLDFTKMGLWDGFSANAIYEYRNKTTAGVYGFDGTLLPVNTQVYHPKGTNDALSLTFTQRFGKDLSLSVGKFNMIDTAAGAPIVGGGDVFTTFWNLNFAAPPSGIVPAYISGFSGSYNTPGVNYTLMVYDPRDSQNVSGFEGWGKDGINTRLALRFPVKVGGNDGYHTLVGAYSTQDKIDLADLPYIAVPPGTPSTPVDTKRNSWYLGWNFQQYLWQDPGQPGRGWGLFGQLFVTDANPNLYHWGGNLGIAGNSPIPGRSLDRFGVGVFNTSFSGDLTASLQTITGRTIAAERGIEAFYNFAVFPWFRVMADLQYIKPGVSSFDNGFFAGVSLQLKF